MTTQLESSAQSEGAKYAQAALKPIMENELQNATFQSQDIMKTLLPVKDSDVTLVLQRLQQDGITHNQLRYQKTRYESGQSKTPMNNAPWFDWPATNSPEQSFYIPFAYLLNKVLEVSREVCPCDESYHKSLSFFVHGRKLEHEGVILGRAPLKPALVGTHSLVQHNAPLKWNTVEIAVEVKNRWREMISQGAMYARCLFAVIERRQFALVICFDQALSQVRFVFYHRAGVTSSFPMKITHADGFKTFVAAVIGLHFWRAPHAAGMDMTRDEKQFLLPDIGRYVIEEILCSRICVRGQATRVYNLVKADEHTVGAQQASSNAADALALPTEEPIVIKPPTKTQPSDKPPPRKRSRTSRDQMEAACDPIVLPSVTRSSYQTQTAPNRELLSPPASLILKDSWPLERCVEAEMFSSFKGSFGVPSIHTSYTVEEDGKIQTTEKMVPDDAEFWNIFRDDSHGHQREVRNHQRILSRHKGARLDSAPGPRQLFESLIHSLLGHWNLFKGGWLHRDVSIGNILHLKEKVQCPAVTDFTCTKDITECIGMITDGDQAISWKLDQRELATHRSGTLPFTSLRLLNAWQNSRVAVHTAIDDIESFLWVLIWALLASIRRRGELLPCEQSWFESMNTDSVHDLERHGILYGITLSVASKEVSRLICHFSSIIQTWGEFSFQAAVAITSLVAENPGEPVSLEKYTALCREFYGKYIEAGVAELSKLPETWAEVGL